LHQPPLAYRALCERVEMAGAALARMGFGRSNRIALALGNGPDAAVATLAAMSWCACAPLNPALSKDAGAAILSRLRVDALIAGI
jgi:acyl-coenzyme A synthetase/AMP-(fatty) acid ligase